MEVVSSDPGQHDAPQYYRPGPSTGRYPQYPQNPYPHGWHGGATPPASPQQAPAAPAPQPGTTAPPTSGWGPPPAGLGGGPQGRPARPRQMVTALVALVAAALPFVVTGIGSLFVTFNESLLNDAGIPRGEFDAALAQSGLTMAQFGDAVRILGVVFVAMAVIWIVLAVAAFLGASWARVVLIVLLALYGLPLLAIMGTSGQPMFAVLVIGIAAVGVTLLFGRPAKEWYATRRLGAASRS